MGKKRSPGTKATRGGAQERTVPLGYIGNPTTEPPPQTIEIPEAFRPPRAPTPSESSSDRSQSSGEGSDG